MAGDHGRFIVIEGLDAAGTSTQCQRLVAYLQRLGPEEERSQPRKRTNVRAVLTKEPTGGPAGAMIRLALAHRLKGPNTLDEDSNRPASSELDDHTMALLFAADRMDHVNAVIRPSLNLGIHVVSDRYLLSSLAYQGLSVSREWLLEINRFATVPDLTFYLDAEVAYTQHRMKESRLDQELYESPERQRLIQQSYRQVIAARHKELGDVQVIDAKTTPEIVERKIRQCVDRLLGKRAPASSDEELTLPI